MPAEPTKERVERNPSLNPESDDDWERLLAMLPAELDALARECKAIVRRRRISSASMLLRLVLIYVTCCFSLRAAASWAARALGVMLTDDALGYRFAHATPFVQGIAEKMLADKLHEKPATGASLRILDATMLSEPGSDGTDWRVHVTYDPARPGAVGIEVTDAHGGEHVRRAATATGDLLIGDMGLGHTSDLREAKERHVHALLRAHLQSLAVDDLRGRRMAPSRLLNASDRGHLDHDVLLPEQGYDPLPARLVVAPLPPEQAGRARQRLRKAASKRGRPVSALTLRLAGYFCCITTLTKQEASAAALLTWYRVRWQVELLFKRYRGLLHLGELMKAKPALVTLQIWGRLLVAILVEQMAAATRSAKSTDAKAPAVSLWRLDRIHQLDVVLAVYGGASLADRLAEAKATADRLRERPRRRCGAEKLIDMILAVLHPPSTSPALA